jgi:hypothetical protein
MRMERAVTPADCALAVALPLTFEEFEADAGSPERDFIRSVLDGSGRSLRDTWDEVYAPKVVDICERVAAKARALGGTVVTRTTAGLLRELLAKFPVVCLIAHSIQAPVEAEDVLRPDAIQRTIEAGGSLLARHLRSRLDTAAHASAPGRAWLTHEQIAALLDESLAATRAFMASTVRRDAAARQELHVDRVMLEDCFGDALRRGRVLEVRDGMLTMDDLLAEIPLEFAGVLDLSVCNSIVLGESIKRRRDRCLVVENTFLARVDLRFVRYALALTVLARRPARYTDALLELSRDLMRSKP